MTQKKMNRGAQQPTAYTTAQVEELKQLKLRSHVISNLANEFERQLEIARQWLDQRVETNPSLAHQRGTIAYSANECVPACPSPPTASSNTQGRTVPTFQADVCVQGQSPTGLYTADENNLGARTIHRSSGTILGAQTIHLPCEANGESPAALPKCDQPSRSANVFVRNLDKRIGSRALYDTFSLFGNILSCKVVTDRETGLSQGYGYVHY